MQKNPCQNNTVQKCGMYVFVQNYEGKKVQQTIGQYNQNLRRSGIS